MQLQSEYRDRFYVPKGAGISHFTRLLNSVDRSQTQETRDLLDGWFWRDCEQLQLLLDLAIDRGNVDIVNMILHSTFDYCGQRKHRMYRRQATPAMAEPAATFLFSPSNIITAVVKGSIPILQLMRAQGWDVNEPLLTHGDALTIALLTNAAHGAAAWWLLTHGAKPDNYLTRLMDDGERIADCHDSSLEIACRRLDTPQAVVRLLIQKGALVNGPGALHEAARVENLPAMEILINEGGALVNAVRCWGLLADVQEVRPLDVAADAGCMGSIRYLLEMGARRNVRDNVFGKTPMEIAQFRKHWDCVALLED